MIRRTFVVDINPEWYLVDTRTAARLAGVKPATIRGWHHRGRLRRAGTRQRALWDIREVLANVRR